MSRTFATVASLGLLFAPLSVGWAGESANLEQLVVEMAESPSQHAALADYYEHKAAEARSEAERHVKTGKSYHRGNMGSRKKMKSHCDSLAATYRELADEYDSLAALHRESAE